MPSMPVLFVGHGSPMNAIADNGYTRALRELGGSLPRPDAVLAVSAHWLTPGVKIGTQQRPELIYDFYGFPDELYEVSYPCKGAPAAAKRALELLRLDGALADESWGIDHGAWSPLRHIFPDAGVPVFQLNVDMSRKPEYHYDLARKLRPLRDEGILVVGSGNIVHNLGAVDFSDAAVRDAVAAGDHKALFDYEKLPSGGMAVPTPDHYLPLFYALGMMEQNERPRWFFEEIQNASVSMRCLIVQ